MVFSNDSFVYKAEVKAKRESSREIWCSHCPYHKLENKKFSKKHKSKIKTKPWSKAS